MTLSEAIPEYLEWKGSYAPAAARNYRPILNTFGRMSGNIALDTIQQQHVTKHILHLRTIYKERTVTLSTAVLRDFFGYHQTSVKKHLIRFKRFEEPVMPFLDRKKFIEIDNLLYERNWNDLKKKVIHHLLFSTGVRISELLDMRISEVSMQDRVMVIRTKKNKRLSYIMWNERAHELLCMYVGIRLCKEPESDFLFPWTPRSVQRWISKLGDAVGMRLHPHMYRHGKAHDMLSKNAQLFEIATVLRHVDVNSTRSMYLGLQRHEFEKIGKKYG